MAGRTLQALTASAIIGGALFVSTPAALADYPNVTPPGGGGTPAVAGGVNAGGGITPLSGGGGSATGGSLPFTGAEVLPLAGAGAALLLTGSIVLAAGRRRSTSLPG